MNFLCGFTPGKSQLLPEMAKCYGQGLTAGASSVKRAACSQLQMPRNGLRCTTATAILINIKGEAKVDWLFLNHNL